MTESPQEKFHPIPDRSGVERLVGVPGLEVEPVVVHRHRRLDEVGLGAPGEEVPADREPDDPGRGRLGVGGTGCPPGGCRWRRGPGRRPTEARASGCARTPRLAGALNCLVVRSRSFADSRVLWAHPLGGTLRGIDPHTSGADTGRLSCAAAGDPFRSSGPRRHPEPSPRTIDVRTCHQWSSWNGVSRAHEAGPGPSGGRGHAQVVTRYEASVWTPGFGTSLPNPSAIRVRDRRPLGRLRTQAAAMATGETSPRALVAFDGARPEEKSAPAPPLPLQPAGRRPCFEESCRRMSPRS